MVLLLAYATPVPHAWAAPCTCDCDANGLVEVQELVLAVRIAQGLTELTRCPAADPEENGFVGINELIAGVRAALEGCLPPTPSPLPTLTPMPADVPPADVTELLDWLRAGRYLEWLAESETHPSGGPHFGSVRVFVNNTLFSSLDQTFASHPAGSAAVKELYGSSGEVQGGSVSIKVQANSDGGAGWYWYDRFQDRVFAAGLGVAVCTRCHGGNFEGFVSKDFVLTPFPLQ